MCRCRGVALSLIAGGASAQQKYPVKPIRLITPFAPGGGTDILARIIGPQVSESLGQPVVVDNRPGGGGTLGAGITVRSDPDGYTFILVSGSYGANAALHDLPYDSVTDITPIILIGTTGLLVSMHPSVPIKTIKEVIAYARANPGKLNFGSAGVGGLGHLAQELFQLHTKVQYYSRSVQGQRPRHERAAQRGSGLELQQPGAEHPAREVGTAACHRPDHPQALARDSGGADHRRDGVRATT